MSIRVGVQQTSPCTLPPRGARRARGRRCLLKCWRCAVHLGTSLFCGGLFCMHPRVGARPAFDGLELALIWQLAAIARACHEGPLPSPCATCLDLKSDRMQWAANEERSSCTLCGQTFTWLRRRHHCRACGGLFCDSCSPENAMILPPRFGCGSVAQRVCIGCRQCLPEVAEGVRRTHYDILGVERHATVAQVSVAHSLVPALCLLTLRATRARSSSTPSGSGRSTLRPRVLRRPRTMTSGSP